MTFLRRFDPICTLRGFENCCKGGNGEGMPISDIIVYVICWCVQGVKGSSLYGKCLPNASQNGVSQRASSTARKAAVVKAEIGDSLVGLSPCV